MLDIIRTKFTDHTIICIAHRLNTIMDFDQVIVLDEGRIIERGEPGVLALEPSIFASLLRAATGQDKDEDDYEEEVWGADGGGQAKESEEDGRGRESCSSSLKREDVNEIFFTPLLRPRTDQGIGAARDHIAMQLRRE
jgi:ABC-type multidrug transport system ATPase subunit